MTFFISLNQLQHIISDFLCVPVILNNKYPLFYVLTSNISPTTKNLFKPLIQINLKSKIMSRNMI